MRLAVPVARGSLGGRRDEDPGGRREPNSTFRENLTQRGLGRGGAREIVCLDWPNGGVAGGPWLIASSSRRSGKLQISEPLRLPVRFAYPESFLPIWSLGDLLQNLAQPDRVLTDN